MASVARYCCCGCPDSVEVTFSGIDASACTGCNTNGFISWQVRSISFDGTYVVAKSFENSLICQYLVQTAISFNDWDEYSDATCSTLLAGGADDLRAINIIYTKSSGTFTTVDIAGIKFSGSQVGYGFHGPSSGSFGDTLTNGLACNDQGFNLSSVALANSGTAVIQRA